MLIVQGRDWELVRARRGMFEFKGVKAGSRSRCIMLTDTAKYAASNTVCFWLSHAVNGTRIEPVAQLTYETARNIERGKVDLEELNDYRGRLERRGIRVESTVQKRVRQPSTNVNERRKHSGFGS